MGKKKICFQYWYNGTKIQTSSVIEEGTVEYDRFISDHWEYAKKNSIADIFIGTRQEAEEKGLL